jgi:hypothetical protein
MKKLNVMVLLIVLLGAQGLADDTCTEDNCEGIDVTLISPNGGDKYGSPIRFEFEATGNPNECGLYLRENPVISMDNVELLLHLDGDHNDAIGTHSITSVNERYSEDSLLGSASWDGEEFPHRYIEVEGISLTPEDHWSISFWAQSSQSNEATVAMFTNNNQFFGNMDDGHNYMTFNPRFGSSCSVQDTSVPINDGIWHHYVGVKHGRNKVELFIDGNLVDFTQKDCGGTSFSENLRIFAKNPVTGARGRGWRGRADEFGFFNIALTPDQISELYNNGQGLILQDSDLVLSQSLEVPTNNPVSIEIVDNISDGEYQWNIACDGEFGPGSSVIVDNTVPPISKPEPDPIGSDERINAIVAGVGESLDDATIVQKQRIYIRYQNGTQRQGVVDVMVEKDNQRWILQDTNSDDFGSINTVISFWKNIHTQYQEIVDAVKGFIVSTE